jgi:hypothetical protein
MPRKAGTLVSPARLHDFLQLANVESYPVTGFGTPNFGLLKDIVLED